MKQAKRRRKRQARRRLRHRTQTEQTVEDSYQKIQREIMLYGRREATKLLKQLAPKLRTKDAQFIVRRIAEGKHVGADTVKIVLFVRKWWGSAGDVVRAVNRKLGKRFSYTLISEEGGE